ncbi:MAG: hypothetical protein IT379_19510 [Deltaproteobacteria bacterium]|nr:hypothetical protein [Deltaproteobacteria bacterium]
MAGTTKVPFHARTSFRFAAGVLLLAIVGFLVSRVDFGRSLAHLDAQVVSGSRDGNYHRLVDSLAAEARRHRGQIGNVATQGSVDNMRRLSAAASSGNCEVQFGLVQDGGDWASAPELELVGRLAHAESIVLLGRDASRLTELRQLARLRIGIGPAASGTARVARQIFGLPEVRPLAAALSHHTLAEQIDLAARGELDLAMLVIDEDAAIVSRAVRERGLQLAELAHLDSIARRITQLRTGAIGAGQYDPVRMLPPRDVPALRIETLVVGNGCASRSQTMGMLGVLARRFPDFVLHNRQTPNLTGLTLASAAAGYFEHNGPEIADEYAPWLVDIMPPGNWVYIVMSISVLFNVMGFGHRFRLWRVDAQRVSLEREVRAIFGPETTLGDIERMEPRADLKKPDVRAQIDDVTKRLVALADRSRAYSLSMLVPMGQEMGYRYQEQLIHETIAALNAFRARSVDPPTHATPSQATGGGRGAATEESR